MSKKQEEQFEPNAEIALGEKDELNVNRALRQWDRAEMFLTNEYEIRNNVIKNSIEMKKKPKNGDVPEEWIEFDENNLFRVFVKNLIPLSLQRMITLIKSSFVTPYNPFIDYFKYSLPKWDGETDYIQQMAELVTTTDNERWQQHFKKHVVRAVACAINPKYYNKHMMILYGAQGVGKSGFWEMQVPAPLADYVINDLPFDKDGLAALANNWIINVEELAALAKYEIGLLKSIISMIFVKFRAPFERRAKRYDRVCTFVGSTNRRELLQDETGNVRFLIFEVLKIDWEKKKEMFPDDASQQAFLNNMYAQAFDLYMQKHGKFEYALSKDDLKENEMENEKYKVTSPERDMILKYFSPGDSINNDGFFTSTDIAEYIGSRELHVKFNQVQVGRIINHLGFERSTKRKNNMPIHGYYLKVTHDPERPYEEKKANYIDEKVMPVEEKQEDLPF